MRYLKIIFLHKLMRVFFLASFLFYLLIPNTLSATEKTAPPKLELRVSPSQIHQGQSARLVVSVSNVKLDDPPVLKELFENFTVDPLPHSQRSEVRVIQDVSGMRRIENRTIDYNYIITPKKTGTLTISPPQITSNGTPVEASAIEIVVLEPSQTDLVILETSLNPSNEVYPLVPFDVIVDVYIKANPERYEEYDPLSLIVQNLDAPALTIPWLESRELNNVIVADSLEDWLNSLTSTKYGFALNNYRLSSSLFDFDFSFFSNTPRRSYFMPSPKQVERVDSSGKNTTYWKYSFQRRMRASSEATITLAPTTIDGTFLDFTDPDNPKTKSVFLSSDPLELIIKAIPEENAPSNYVGIYGNIQQNTTLSTSKTAVGDAITLSVEYTGYGSFTAATAPDIANLKGIKDVFKVYPPSERSTESGVAFDFKLRPLKEGRHEIPVIRSSFFNVETGGFESLTSSSIDIEVTAGILHKDMESYLSPDEASPRELDNNNPDSIHKKQAMLNSIVKGVGSVTACLIMVVALFLFIRACLQANTRRITSSNRRIIDMARSTLEDGIKQLDVSPYEGFSRIRLAFLQLVSRRLPHKIDAHTDAEILAFIDKEFAKDVQKNQDSAQTICKLKEFFKEAEQFRFGGATAFDTSKKSDIRELFLRWTNLLLIRSKKLSSLAKGVSK